MAQGEAPTTANLIGYLGKATQWGRELWAPGEDNGAIPINVQDQTTKAFDFPFSKRVGDYMSLAVDGIQDAYTVTMSPGHTFAVGDSIVMQDIEAKRGMAAGVLGVAGDVLTLDMPLTFRYRAATTVVAEITSEMNVNGAVTRQTFEVSHSLDVAIDVTRIMFELTCTDPPAFQEFGDIAAPGLTRGVACRVVNGENNNLWNVKTNADLALLMYDVTIYEQAQPFNVNGIAGRLTYGGQTKHGVVIRLAQDQPLEVIIQDDLTSLLSFRMSAAGHVVTD